MNSILSLAAALIASAVAAQATLPMTEAEVRKVDLDAKKITLRHGEIKNLDMPPMTMVFQAKDPAMLDNLKAGDKVLFSADKINGAYTVMSIEPAKK
jgi:Cu/Ag efflux protein CusF